MSNMDSTFQRMVQYINRYLFSFVHITLFAVLGGIILAHPEWMLVMGNNKTKLMAIVVASLPLSFCLDYLRYSTSTTWSMRLGVLILFYVLAYFAFLNFRLPTLSLNYYNLLYIIVFYVFSLSLMSSSYFFTLPAKEAWNNIVYFIYSYLYAILYAVISVAGLLLILFLLSKGLSFGLTEQHFLDLGAYVLVICFQLYFLYIKSDTESSPIEDYPTPLLIFVSYVLFPLFVILTGIIAVIVLQLFLHSFIGDGWIGYILLAYWLLGLILFFLIYPLRNSDTKYSWIKKFPARFSLILIPLGALMVYDIVVRVLKMGFTEPRYIYMWFGVLSMFLGLQYLLDRKNASLMRMGSALLVVLAILLYGGLNMSKVSNRSQNTKVLEILKSYNLIDQNKLDTAKVAEKKLHLIDQKTVQSSLDYLESKQYSDYKKILPQFWGKKASQDQYFEYKTDPWFSEMLATEQTGRTVKVEILPEVKLTSVVYRDSLQRVSFLSNQTQFSNITTIGTFIKFRYIPLEGYSVSLYAYLERITKMLNLALENEGDELTYYIEDENDLVLSLDAYNELDTVKIEMIVSDLNYTIYEDSFNIKKLNAYILY